MGYALTSSQQLGFRVGHILPSQRHGYGDLPSPQLYRKPRQQKQFLWCGFLPGESKGRRCWALIPRAASGKGRRVVTDGGGRGGYHLSSEQGSSLPLQVKQVASFLLPAGAFVAFSFGVHLSQLRNIFFYDYSLHVNFIIRPYLRFDGFMEAIVNQSWWRR